MKAIHGICHFGLSVADLEESIRFYTEMRPKNRGKAFTHFGLAATSVKEVFAFQGHLKSRGAKIVKEAYERRDGASLYFLDPNGYTLEYIFFDPRN